jgi:hypothetical protein
VAGGLIVVALAIAAGLFGGHPGWSLLSIIVLLVALNRFFFSSRFTIDPEGITARYLLRSYRRRWQELRRFAHDERGGLLSTRVRPSRFDTFRGVPILFGAHRDRVVAEVEQRLAAREGAPCSG